MKKRLLSALLALALVFVLLPTTALAGETTGKDYDISINGKGWKFEKDTPVYFYGYDPSNYFFSTTADHQWTTNSNLMLTKEGNTVTITIRPSKYHPYESPQFTLKKESTSTEKNDVPCIEMGNGNNLVITGKGTLNITRNESKSRGAALYSDVGDITINGGITVNVSFLNGKDYNNKNVSSNAIYVGDNHNLTVSGSGTNVTATNQGFDSSPATVCVEGGTITVSGGASLSATNTYDDNRSGSDDVKIQHFNSYAISGTKSNPCTLIVADEKSSVTATTNDFTDIAESWAFKYTTIQAAGATIKAGSSVSNSTVTTIDNISGQRYAKISVPALERTSDVLIAGKDAVVGVETSIPSANGSGTYFYDQASKTLTLNNVTITSGTNAIQFAAAGTYTVKLEGTNKISNVSNGISVTDDKYITSLNVTITGTGSLDISAKGLAINMKKGDLKFENTGEIKLTTSNISPTHNVLSVSGNITIADMEKYKVEGIVQDNTKDGGDTVTLSEASHLKGYQNPDGTAICLKTITITPTPAKDSTISYGKKTLKQGEIIKGEISGTATVATKGNTITLNNFKGTQALSFEATLADSTLVLEGTSTLSSIVTTQKGLTISGSGSLTVGSIKVTNNDNIRADLTITDGAAVIAKSNATRAIDIKGDLTVTNGSLTATSKSDSVPTVQVGGNASFTGSTVTITNHSDRQGKSGEYSYAVSTGLYVGGTLDIKNAAKVTSTVIGGNAIYAKGDITISGDNTEVNAKNSAYKFSAISTNGTVNISDNSTVKAENLKKHQGDPTGVTDPSTGKTYNACPAITGKIANKNSQNKLHIAGFTTSSAGSQNPTEGTPLYLDIAPGSVEPYIHHYYVTITRGDEVTRTNSPVVIAGTTLLNDTYYTINGSTVDEGTESNYNAFYDSKTKTLKLNNASINGAGTNKAIEANVGGYTFTIELVGNNIIKTSGFANNVIDITGNLYFTGSGTAEISGKGTPIYATYKIDVSADVTITNTEKAGSFTFSPYGENYKGANTFAIGAGYTAYATTDKTTWAVYDNTTASENESYTTLRITKENLAPTTPTTYTVTITAGDNMKIERESGALTQEVTKGAAITEVKFMAASGHYFPADYVSKMNLPAGLTAEIRENSWYLIISGTPTSDVTINLPAASVRPTITVSMPTPAAGNTPATASDITLTYSDINKSISKNLTISNVVWQSYVPNGDGSITPGEALSSGDKFEAGKTYFVRITHEYVAGDYDIVPAAGITLDYTESDSTYMMLLFYTTGAPCNHEYTNDWLANGNTHWHECKLCRAHAGEVAHTFGDWITDTPATDTTDGSKHRTCSVCQYQENATIPKTGTGEIVPPTPDNPGTIVIIRPAEEEKPAQQPNPSTGANDLVGLAVAAAVAAALGSAALLRKHD